MMQGRLLPALVLGCALAATSLPASRSDAAPRRTTPAASAPRRGASLRQFSGVLTALDKTTLTVEKSGKAAKTLVFSRHPEMRTTGDLEKDARVTVWYRDEDGHPVAHRVVVKGAPVAENH